MTDEEIKQYFKYHNENIKLLKIGFDHTRSQIKNLYKTKNKAGDYLFSLENTEPKKLEARKIEKSLSRILSGIQVSMAEECLKRLLYEKDIFSEDQRNYLLERGALDQKWYATLKIVFSIAYDLVPSTDSTCKLVKIKEERQNLGNELVDQYLQLRTSITDNLVPNFSIRNKVQHGEWEYAFKPRYSAEFCQDTTDLLNNENLVTITSRYTLINTIYQMIVDLGRFKSDSFSLNSMTTPFEYYYDDCIKKINYEVYKINNPNIDDFIIEIIEREKRGELYREA